MLRVRTYVDYCPIHGVGLFLAEDILAGTIVWEYDRGLDIEIPDETVQAATGVLKEFFIQYPYKHSTRPVWILCLDSSRFTNHSDDPNLYHSDDVEVAMYNMAAGTELTLNYRAFDGSYAEKLGIKNGATGTG